MGLTKEVRDFFVNRINGVLDKKAQDILKVVDEKEVKAEVIKRFAEKTKAGYLYQELIQITGELEAIEKRADALRSELSKKLNEAGVNHNPYYRGIAETFESMANRDFKDAVLKEKYPEQFKEIEKIENLKSNVQACVLLATTEPKLVSTLNKLLNSYGGDIEELLSVLPKE